MFGIAAVAWVIGGTLWYKQRFCATQDLTTAAVVPVAHTASKAEGQLSLCFPQGGSKVLLTLDQLETLKLTADYLSMNTDKLLIINGLSAKNEAQSTPSVSEPILATERAEAVKTSLVHLGAPTGSMQTNGQVIEKLPTQKGFVFDAVKFQLVDNPQGRFQALNIFYRQNGFQFADNEELTNYFTALFHFLEKNPKSKIYITAFRSNTEGGQLDKKRLDFLKKYLKTHDFNLSQFLFSQDNAKKPIPQDNDSKRQKLEIRIQIV